MNTDVTIDLNTLRFLSWALFILAVLVSAGFYNSGELGQFVSGGLWVSYCFVVGKYSVAKEMVQRHNTQYRSKSGG